MRHVVLGTAGHVDHGKTALIKALTGTDTDRLKEEKERGITIELGFASLKLPSGQTLGVVDVPGHEKFIKHMVSGAAGIDLVMMIIAADEGIMPQTKEHLNICSLLGIRTGLVALTKIDMVENDWLELVKTEIQDFLKGTFLEGVPVIPVSALKQKGIDELTAALDTVVQNIPEKNDCGIFRLPVDRVFTMKGFGTVVTGTLISDSISVGEDVLILPEEINTRIRGIQVHNQPTQEATAGQRTAINLQGIEKESLQRGDVLARYGTIVPSIRLDVYIDYLKNNAKSLKNRTLTRLHTGTSEIIARVILIEKDELAPGEKGFAQLILEKKDVVVAGDRFVLRSYSPITTIGGGLIIDPLPPKHKRLNKKVIEELATLLNGTLPKKIEVILERAGFAGTNLRHLVFRLGTNAKNIKEALQSILSQKSALITDKEETNIISASFYEKLAQSAAEIISQYQKKNPLREGISKEELKASLGRDISPKLFFMLLQNLADQKKIEVDKETVRLFGHKVTLADDLNSIRQAILKIYNEAGLTPPSFKDVINNFQDKKTEAQNIIKLLLKDGSLIKINEELIFTREALDNLRKNYKALLVKEGKATPVSFKELTGLSRKYIIPLMEYFDTDKLTMRVGDHRILREKE
ncbi:MAG TPA: selenocysteine-specific translation elongation factor [Smithellaceae bacterium]|nr:selenocysteine-specific translation elongation factor [Smithellaceae bacterium]HOF77834.1 selenocysteine-specific translation elongation factor [Smithellaceae bacterium]HOM68926.1 selenocysteine-specific translation elongation factor [Smithellaceae bacterium]HOS09240.1 selenocysteine-specific translation elongation factor [Smithellaceae bacterium]HPD50281.1 selenocysteine-specific translation elongation factor [Smithellaceae bacterium]